MQKWLIKNGKLNHPVIFLLILVVSLVGFSFYKYVSQSEAAPPNADLSVTKTDGVGSVTSGGTTTYTITVSNAGPFPSDGAIVTDLAASGLSKTGSATCVGSGGAACTASFTATDLEVGFAITTLPVGGSVDITFTANVTALSGSVANTASVAGTITLDPNPGNDSSTDTDTVTAPALPVVSGIKTVTGTYTQGGAITYTITLTNTGGATQSNNPGPEFTDNFSSDLTSVSWTCAGGGGGACTASGAGNISDDLTLPAGGSVTYTVNATISPSYGGGTISNQGTINYDSDNNGTNNASALTDDTAVGGASDPTDFTVSAPADIDCGLRAYDGSVTITFACESGTPTSAFQINDGTTTYGVILVDPSDPDASPFRIETSGGTKALKAL